MSMRRSSRERRPNLKFDEGDVAQGAPHKTSALKSSRKSSQKVRVDSSQLTPNAAITGKEQNDRVATRSQSAKTTASQRALQNVRVNDKQMGVKHTLTFEASDGAAAPSLPAQITKSLSKSSHQPAEGMASPHKRSPSKRPQRAVGREQPQSDKNGSPEKYQSPLKVQQMREQPVEGQEEAFPMLHILQMQMQYVPFDMALFEYYDRIWAKETSTLDEEQESAALIPISVMCPIISNSPSRLLPSPQTQQLMRQDSDSWVARLTNEELDTWIAHLEEVPPQSGVSPYVLPHSLLEDIV